MPASSCIHKMGFIQFQSNRTVNSDKEYPLLPSGGVHLNKHTNTLNSNFKHQTLGTREDHLKVVRIADFRLKNEICLRRSFFGPQAQTLYGF